MFKIRIAVFMSGNFVLNKIFFLINKLSFYSSFALKIYNYLKA